MEGWRLVHEWGEEGPTTASGPGLPYPLIYHHKVHCKQSTCLPIQLGTRGCWGVRVQHVHYCQDPPSHSPPLPSPLKTQEIPLSAPASQCPSLLQPGVSQPYNVPEGPSPFAALISIYQRLVSNLFFPARGYYRA